MKKPSRLFDLISGGPTSRTRLTAPILPPGAWLMATTLQVMLAMAVVLSARGQAPGLSWSTNVNARVFAVDAQTNVYAYTAGGRVVVLNALGVPLKTNTICPLPGFPQRDSAGNFYFAGTFSPPKDFGGMVLTNGPCFVAKYTGSGGLLWAREYGPPGNPDNGMPGQPGPVYAYLNVGDLQVDPGGGVCLGYNYSVSAGTNILAISRFDALGSNTWSGMGTQPIDFLGGQTTRLGAVSATNGHAITYDSVGGAQLSQLETLGGLTAWKVFYFRPNKPPLPGCARPINNAEGELFTVEQSGTIPLVSELTKRDASGTVLWQRSIVDCWPAAPDAWGGLYVADDSGLVARFDYDGNPVWNINLPSPCNSMVTDPPGNRFVSMANGTVARLAAELLSPPVITNAPQGETIFSGTDVVLAVGSTGFTPLRYFWLDQGNFLPGQTNATLTLDSATSAQTGQYSVIVSNIAGSVTSAPALLRVKRVETYEGTQALANGSYTFANPPIFTVRSAFTNGSVFYTLDDTPPTFASLPYSAPFTLTHSATVRAVGYSADFLQSEEADPVNATVLGRHTLSAATAGGGSISLNPPGGAYAKTNIIYGSTNVVTATAVPSAGWSFLYWLGDAQGANPLVNLAMDQDRTIQAVFGTTLATTVAGNGQILLDPPGGVYPYGSVVRLTAVPQPGSYFGSWGNASAVTNSNPLYFTISNANPTVSSIFGVTTAGQAALTVQISGRGQVSANPRQNVYSLNQSVTLTAAPDAGQSFLGWGGDAAGTQNPLTLSLTSGKSVAANFTSRPILRVDRFGLEGLTQAGFRLTLEGNAGSVYEILSSSDLSAWQSLGTVTNLAGEAQFTDPEAIGSTRNYYRAKSVP